jgi:hypothetical protein
MVCGPPPGVYRRRIMHCPACERRRRFVERWDGAWYGSTLYCACGDYFQEDWMGTRPFERGWRKKAQERFRVMWDNAASSENYERYVRADQSFATSRNWRKADRKRAVALELIRRERAA